MRVVIIYTLPPDSPGEDRYFAEFDLRQAALIIAKSIHNPIVRAVHGWPGELVDILSETRADVVFNLCEAPLGRPDFEAHVAAFLEWIGVRFTGCRSETLALCRRKDLTNPILRAAGIAVPGLVSPENPRFPCVVKPSAEDGSAGIHDHSLCHNATQLAYALSQIAQPTIVEEFLPGREFTVTVWGATSPVNLSIGETLFQQEQRLITYEEKWDVSDDADSKTPISYETEIEPRLRDSIQNVAKHTWEAVGARHALRIDIRLDAAGFPRVLDVNPNPAIVSNIGLYRAVQEAGWRWEDFVTSLIEWA